jgi:hypothetical protein
VSRTVTVLSAQVAPVAWDPPATLDKFEDHVRVARRSFPDVDLMIFPELYLTAIDGFTSGGTSDWEQRVAEDPRSSDRSRGEDRRAIEAVDRGGLDLRTTWEEGAQHRDRLLSRR